MGTVQSIFDDIQSNFDLANERDEDNLVSILVTLIGVVLNNVVHTISEGHFENEVPGNGVTHTIHIMTLK